MMDDAPGSDELREIERAFWLADAEYYRRTLAPGCVMVFPGMGIVGRDAILGGIERAPRWSAVDFHDWHREDPEPGVAVVAYRAEARREGERHSYLAFCGSLHVRHADGWRLAFHQRTPAEVPA
jgi:hypothetical protein